MQIKKRKDTGKWGYQICIHGKRYRQSGWNTRDDAQKAGEDLQGKLRREISMAASGSNMACVEAVNGFLEYSARIGKSKNRLRGLVSKTLLIRTLKRSLMRNLRGIYQRIRSIIM
jgi:hypothetical protein